MNYDIKLQLIVMGDSEVGKTSLLYRYQDNKFSKNHLATVGIDYFTKEEKINDKITRIKIWDTAGQERYKSLTYAFSRNANGIILVFDVSKKESFENLKFWIASVNSNLGEKNELKRIIIGNKIDCERNVFREEAESFSQENKCMYFETSAKDNIGISEAIRYIIKLIIEDPKFNINNLSSKDKCKSNSKEDINQKNFNLNNKNNMSSNNNGINENYSLSLSTSKKCC